MAVNAARLITDLTNGGIAPAAAKAIANALANAFSPQISRGNDSVDTTPTESLRLVNKDSRIYELTNIDYSPTEPFADRLSDTSTEYKSNAADHPYIDSQPQTTGKSLTNPAVIGSEYVSATQAPDGVTTVGLKIKTLQGRHLRINDAAGNLEAVPLKPTSQTPKYIYVDVKENSDSTELVLAARAVSTRSVVLADGSVAQLDCWTGVQQSPQLLPAVAPPGAIMPFACTLGAAYLSAWLLCDGSAVSRTTYANLFSAIGTNFGTGDGSTTFNLPDLRGYFVRGSGTNSDGTAAGTDFAKQIDTLETHTHGTANYAFQPSSLPTGSGAINLGGLSGVDYTKGSMIDGPWSVLSQYWPSSFIATSVSITSSGTPTAPSNTATLGAANSAIQKGMRIYGHFVIPDGTVITAISGTSLTLSAYTTSVSTSAICKISSTETRPKNIAMPYYIKT